MVELYFKNIARRWQKAMAEESDQRLVFSPYITSSTAESVLSEFAVGHCDIYTVFSAELFSSMASSLSTLKKLMSLGHRIFHLPQLHAKIFLVPGQFASIGSQNLTLRGTKNKEASIAITDEKLLRRIEHQITPWLSDRILVTEDMIFDMEKLLEEVAPLYKSAREAADLADQRAFEQQAQREAEAERHAREDEERRRQQEAEARKRAEIEALERIRLNAERKHAAERARQQQQAAELKIRHERLRTLHGNIKRAEKSKAIKYGTVRIMESTSGWDVTQTKSLHVQDGDLTSWSVGGAALNLVRANRYLFLQENGKLGWARVMKTRISFVGQSVHWTVPVRFCDRLVKITMQGEWSDLPRDGRNLIIHVNDEFDSEACDVSAWFDLDDVEILRVESGGYPAAHSALLYRLINENLHDFKELIRRQIATPFVYDHNLAGKNAAEFFNGVGAHYEIKAAIVKKNPVLLGRFLDF